MNLFIATAIAVTALMFATANAVPTKRSKLVELLFLNYDKNVRPNYGDEPVNVHVSAYLIDNVVIEETKTHLSFETAMYFRRHWNDSRLKFDGEKPLFGSKDLRDKMWTPDLFIANSYDVVSFEKPEPNVFVKISPDGSILLSERIVVKWRCGQTWDKFPCDTLNCSMEFESYGYSTGDIRISKRKEVGFMNETINNFIIEKVVYGETEVRLSSGNYDRLEIRFTLKRHIPDVKYIIASDKRYPDFYSSIPLKPRFDFCD